jgi:hypothetical protein
MTGIDLIVAAPWIAFAVLLANVCFRLLRSNHASGREGQPLPPSANSAAPMPRHSAVTGAGAGMALLGYASLSILVGIA